MGWIRRPVGTVIVAVMVGAGGIGAVIAAQHNNNPPATPPPSGTCDVNATTGNFSSQVTATSPGQTLCLASGSYGGWSGTNKGSPGIIIKEQDGATATMTDMTFTGTGSIGGFTLDGIDFQKMDGICGNTSNVTFKNLTIHVGVHIDPGEASTRNNKCTSGQPAMNNNNIVFDNIDFPFDGSGCPGVTPSCWGSNEGRVMVVFGPTAASPAGVTIKNSHFHGNCADGIQFTGAGVGAGITVGPGNEFDTLNQGSCNPHVDGIQWVDGPGGSTFTGNWFHDSSHGIVEYDGATTSMTVTKNVFGPNIDGGAPDCVTIGGGSNWVVEHNVFRGCTPLVSKNNQGDISTGWTLRDNILASPAQTAFGGTITTNNYNLCVTSTCAGANSLNGTPTFVGGSTPSSYAGFFTTGGSLGDNAGHDGTDMGLVP